MKLPSGISSHIVPGVNGLDMHLFEAGDREAPAIILLHGYPELGYSWMKMLTPLANAGYRAIAPDLAGRPAGTPILTATSANSGY